MYEFQSVENLTEEEYLELNADIIETPDTDNYLLAGRADDCCEAMYGRDFTNLSSQPVPLKTCSSSCHTATSCGTYNDPNGYYKYQCYCKFTGKK